MGGGLVNFPTRYLKEVELEGEGGESEGGETMDFKTYCDTIIRNYLIDSNINIAIEDVVMPDAYIQITDEQFTMDGDYLKPYLSIIALYNDTLVIDESKIYFGGGASIMNPIFISGNNAEKDASIPIENYCCIITSHVE